MALRRIRRRAALPEAVDGGQQRERSRCRDHARVLARTNAARQVIQPLDDVATALDMKKADFTDAVWGAGIYQTSATASRGTCTRPVCTTTRPCSSRSVSTRTPPTTGDELMAILDQARSKAIRGMWVSALSISGLEAHWLVRPHRDSEYVGISRRRYLMTPAAATSSRHVKQGRDDGW